MSASIRRGYLSFLLLIPLALLVLSPLLYQPAAPSMTVLYASERAQNEQTAFIRTLLVSAHQTQQSLRNRADITPIELLVASAHLGCDLPPREVPITPFVLLTPLERDCLSKYELLRTWSGLITDWNQHSDYDVALPCKNSGSIETSDCVSSLRYDPKTDHILIRSDFMVLVRSKELGITATGPLPSMEVGG